MISPNRQKVRASRVDARDARGGRRDDGDEEEEGGEIAIWGIVDRPRPEAIGSGLSIGGVR